ncbi:MAG: hypothetical protein ACOCYO_01040 [Bacteroidota bacterium]
MSLYNILIYFVCAAFFSCQFKAETNKRLSQKSKNSETITHSFIEGTIWQFQIAEDCINTYTFKKDSTHVYYSCESNTKYYGNYYVDNDTLFIHNTVTNTDSLLTPEEINHRCQEAKYKLILVENKLKHIERIKYSARMDAWVRDDFQFDDDFLFEKVK